MAEPVVPKRCTIVQRTAKTTMVLKLNSFFSFLVLSLIDNSTMIRSSSSSHAAHGGWSLSQLASFLKIIVTITAKKDDKAGYVLAHSLVRWLQYPRVSQSDLPFIGMVKWCKIEMFYIINQCFLSRFSLVPSRKLHIFDWTDSYISSQLYFFLTIIIDVLRL